MRKTFWFELFSNFYFAFCLFFLHFWSLDLLIVNYSGESFEPRRKTPRKTQNGPAVSETVIEFGENVGRIKKKDKSTSACLPPSPAGAADRQAGTRSGTLVWDSHWGGTLAQNYHWSGTPAQDTGQSLGWDTSVGQSLDLDRGTITWHVCTCNIEQLLWHCGTGWVKKAKIGAALALDLTYRLQWCQKT